MKLKDILANLNREFEVSEKDAMEYDSGDKDESTNYFLEREIESLKSRWEILSYADKNLDIFNKPKEEIQNWVKNSSEIKNISYIKRLLFSK